MKTLRIILLTVFTIAVALFSACNKDKDNEKDYRDKWIGTYECEECYREWHSPPIPIYPEWDSTHYYQTILEVTTKEDSMLIFFDKRRNKSYEEKVNTIGHFLKHKYYSSEIGIKGNFNGDSLIMHIISGGHGGGSTSDYKGIKNKSK